MYKLLINKIKEKKPLDKLDDSYIAKKIDSFIKQNPKTTKKTNFNNEKNNGFKTILKAVRTNLHQTYGLFWQKKPENLESHRSSRERINFYRGLYKKIFAITGKPETILDLACGLNPFSIPYMGFKGEYIAIELTREDCKTINNYFRKHEINGKAIQMDITKENNFPKADIAFIFKVFDTIEAKGHKLAEKILKRLDAGYIIVSFATRTIGNRRMDFTERKWFEALLARLNLDYKKLEFENEIFYAVKAG